MAAILNMTLPRDARRKKYVRPVTNKQTAVAPTFRPLPKPLGLGDVRSMAVHVGGFIVVEWLGTFILCELRAGLQVETEIRSRDVAHLFTWCAVEDLRSAKFYRVEDAHERLGEYGRRLAGFCRGGNAAGNDRKFARRKRGGLVG